MRVFDVLNRNEEVFKRTMLEASAGTGKTFSIENIVVRLLIEGFNLESILVVTFTRAATRDLKSRIHENILRAINLLNGVEEGSTIDYLTEIIESGGEEREHALRKLERALSAFDTAQIFTIHSFCAHNLYENIFEGDVNLDSSDSDAIKGANYIRRVIRDFFRGGISQEAYSQAQIKAVLSLFNKKIDKLEEALFYAVSKGIPALPQPDFPELLRNFNKAMRALKIEHGISAEKLRSDFEAMIPHYKGIRDRKRVAKPKVLSQIESFIRLFEYNVYDGTHLDNLIEDGLSILDIFDPENRGDKYPADLPLHTPNLLDLIRDNLLEFASGSPIFMKMVYDCRELLDRAREHEGCLNHDDFLKAMEKALENDSFREHVARKYRAAIIDEFQDTDPLQWKIFKRLFAESSHPLLYLVGDPKQSIYGFRQADIYTYLDAQEAIGKENTASLSTNYRSHPPLVDALNALFSEDTVPGFLSLPKKGIGLKYQPVKHSKAVQERKFLDGKGALHFIPAENGKLKALEMSVFFPFIAKEIHTLVQEKGLQFKDIAILVSDRHQSARAHDYLKKWKIPSLMQRTNTLSSLPAYAAMRELLSAVISPKDESALKLALGGKIIRRTYRDLKALEDPKTLEKILHQFILLREALVDNGFATFLYKFLRTSWNEDEKTVLETLLMEEGGEEFYQDFLQVAALLLEQETENPRSPEALLKYLDDTFYLLEDEEENVKKMIDPTKNAVQILTTHSSKGLEYGVVFTLGLIDSKTKKDPYYTAELNGNRVLAPMVNPQDPCALACLKEEDAEKLRLLYVAMTRAKYRVYCPMILPKDNPYEKPGSGSPMDLFLYKFKDPAFESPLSNSLTRWIDALPNEVPISYEISEAGNTSCTEFPEDLTVTLQAPPEVVVPGADRYMMSFTSLSRSCEMPANTLEPPRRFDAAEKNPHTLPAGAEAGILLHECLENIRFDHDWSDPKKIGNFVAPFVSGSPFEEWKDVFSEILLHAVNTPLVDGFSLAEVKPGRILKEAEFLYASPPEYSPGYIKGFIDLFFEHNGKYYLLDWKSNWLGPGRDAYNKETLEKAMHDNGYFLQADLYREAVKKYLRLTDSSPFESIFGGVIYVFLRGLDRKSNESHGVYIVDEKRGK